MKNSTFLAVLIFLLTFSVNAQIEYIFAAAKDDASTYVEHYVNPAIHGVMYDLNNGWYSRAKTHKLFGFDFTFSASVAMIPDDELYFQFNPSDYSSLSILSGSSKLPTIAGSDTNTQLEINDSGDLFSIHALDGHGDKWLKEFFIPIAIPTPMIQAGVGLPFHTELNLRFFPKTEREGIAFNLLGVGLKHELSQYFQKDDKSVFTISGLAAFTKVNITYSIDNIDVDGDDQAISMKFNTYTAQVIAGINLKIVNFYAGFGYVGGDTKVGVEGTYEFDLDDNGSIDIAVTDPINLDFAMTGYKTTLGTRFNLGPVKIFGDYTFQKYPSITAGVSVSLR